MKNIHPLKARITAQADVTRVDVYDDIGQGGWFSEGLTAKGFANQLAGVTGPLHVHINSGGGDVWDGVAIKNAIESHKGPVTTVVDGIAASIASVIAQAGSERVMMPGAMLMIHDAFTYTGGNAAELAKVAQTLDEVSDNIAAVYARAAGGSAEQWRSAMKEETWYTAEQAVEAGLADRVGDGEAVLPAGLDVAAFATVPGRIAAQLRTLPQAAAAPVTTSHGPFTGTHTHAHPAFGAQGDDAAHEHEHSHDGDADHGHDHDGDHDGDDSPRDKAPGQVLGIETMPIVDKAMPIHHTASDHSKWDGPAAVAAMPNDEKTLRYCHAWYEDGDDPDAKNTYRFPHHKTDGGPANLNACRNGLARLEDSKIPEADKVGVRAHLQAHLNDAKPDEKDGDGGKSGTHDHAEPPAWLNDDTTPYPEWLNPAKEATQ